MREIFVYDIRGGFGHSPLPDADKRLRSSPRPRNLGRVDGGFLVERANAPFGPIVESSAGSPYEISHFPLAEVCNIEQRPHPISQLKCIITYIIPHPLPPITERERRIIESMNIAYPDGQFAREKVACDG